MCLFATNSNSFFFEFFINLINSIMSHFIHKISWVEDRNRRMHHPLLVGFNWHNFVQIKHWILLNSDIFNNSYFFIQDNYIRVIFVHLVVHINTFKYCFDWFRVMEKMHKNLRVRLFITFTQREYKLLFLLLWEILYTRSKIFFINQVNIS